MAVKTIAIQVQDNLVKQAKKEYKGDLSQLLEELIIEYLSKKKKRGLKEQYKNYYLNLNTEDISEDKELIEEFHHSDWEMLAKIEQEETD